MQDLVATPAGTPTAPAIGALSGERKACAIA